VRDSPSASRRTKPRASRGAGSLVARLRAAVACRPVDCAAAFVAAATTIAIIVNAVVLQSPSHPAPFIVTPAPQARPVPFQQAAARSADPMATHSTTPLQATQAVPLPAPAPVRHNDPIAELIGPSPRILAVQRTLSEYGYGQIKPSGMLDDATSAAIQKFEREHKLPVSGRVSDRLVAELTAITGHPIQ